MSHLLRFNSAHGEKFYFVRYGLQWPHRPERRIIDETTNKVSEARVFPSAEEAQAMLASVGNPPNWEVIPK